MDLQIDKKMKRMDSRLTDQLVTVDSPRRDSRAFSQSIRRTIQSKGNFVEPKGNMLDSRKNVWHQSASSMTRQKSPSHGFPQAQRFSSLQKDENRNRLILKLNLVQQIANYKGALFAKSKRIDHFKPKKMVEEFPSPASYFSDMLIGSKLGKSRALSRNISSATAKMTSFGRITSECMNYEIKGVTIPKQKNPSKVFMHHGQNIPYQPEVTLNNPGVGKYQINPEDNTLKNTKKFCIGRTLKKFNQFLTTNPGPGAYGREQDMVSKRVKSANFKGTFQLSKRTYLVDKNLEHYSPAPNSYRLKRFLEI